MKRNRLTYNSDSSGAVTTGLPYGQDVSNDGLYHDDLVYHHLYINNSRREGGTRSAFYIKKPEFGTLRMTQFLIQGVTMDYNIYNIYGPYTSLAYIMSTTPTEVKTIVIPEGNYTITSLITALNLAASTAEDSTFYDLGYRFSYSSFTGKISITTAETVWGSGSLYFRFATTQSNMMGLKIGINENTVSTYQYTTVQFPDVISLRSPKYINVHSYHLTGQTSKVFASKGVQSGELAKIPANVTFGDLLYFKLNHPFDYDSYTSQGQLDVFLTDENGVELQLNGGDFLMHLVFFTSSKVFSSL